MPYDGNGVFNRLFSWTSQALGGFNIESGKMDADTDDIANGLSTAITKDGQTTITANIPFNNKRIVGLANPVGAQDAATKFSQDAAAAAAQSAAVTAANSYTDGKDAAQKTYIDNQDNAIIASTNSALATKQPLAATLTSLSALASTVDTFISGQFGLVAITAFGRSLVAAANASAAQTVLGMSTYFKTLLPAADAPAFRALIGKQYAVSVETVITSGGQIAPAAHNLVAVPNWAQIRLRCVTAENGYAVGDYILIGMNNTGTVVRNNTPKVTATQFSLRFSSDANCFSAGSDGAGVPAILTNANWRATLIVGL